MGDQVAPSDLFAAEGWQFRARARVLRGWVIQLHFAAPNHVGQQQFGQLLRDGANFERDSLSNGAVPIPSLQVKVNVVCSPTMATATQLGVSELAAAG